MPTISRTIAALDRWLDDEFTAANTAAEEIYFAARRDYLPGRAPDLLHAGARLIAPIAAADLPEDPMDQYRLLGSVGLYLAACRRHRLDDQPAILAPVWDLATRLGTALGVAPRYVFAHQVLYGYRTFTSLPDEDVFVTYNGAAVVAQQRAADALRRISTMGVSSPLAGELFEQAAAALGDALDACRALADRLDVERFYLCIRPYFATYRVGDSDFRGANAGDFAAVNEIDLRLGLCHADDPFYGRVLREKESYMPPGDRQATHCAARSVPLPTRLLEEPITRRTRVNARLLLDVCRAHGAAASFHHNRLVRPFLARPAATMPTAEPDRVTASGPPLEVVLADLARLRDLRVAHTRLGAAGASAVLDRLRAMAD
ncbi:DUF1864 family protein [Actinokineospora auranticolor]|uniref:Uncharacterized protein DUF1864 n=1 Tax=Actinokineospora auranticolor TaxID=155976 RepID=A0A2S6GC38_9PSEU|nr:monodechloroaminopyrrolnitrin synthase PrnB family protein [Actinokineospora auranticolor]PPK62051.1 uncharacterized protein DUF1864 [Actinokineospora auranticolor]